jgi:polar amino acid transport system substrate-binding protein
MRPKKLLILPLMVLALVAGLAISTPRTADAQALERIVASGELRVGMSGNQAPYNAVSRTGDLIGLDVDLANMLAGAFGVSLNIVVRPFPQLLPALQAGEVDIVISGMAITAERSVDVSFVGPYLLTGNSILTNSRTLAAIDSAGQINRADLKLAALENSTSHRFVQRFLPEAQLTTTQNYDDAVAMVLSDEVDALVADMSVCLLSMLRYPNQGLATLNEPLSLEPAGVAMLPTDPQLENLIRNFLWAFEGTGLLEQLREEWLEDGSWIAALP